MKGTDVVIWRGKTYLVVDVIEMRVRNKNHVYDKWRGQWTFEQLDGFCTEALMRFGMEPYLGPPPRLTRGPAHDEWEQQYHRRVQWRRNFRAWILKSEIAKHVTAAAQFRKYYNSWYTFMEVYNRG